MYDQHASKRSINVGDTVYARNFGKGSLWLPGEVIQQTGPLSFKIQLEDNRVIRRHMNHIRLRASDVQSQSELHAPPTEENACGVPLNVSELESAIDSTPAPDAAEQTSEIPEVKVSEIVPSPKLIILDIIPIRRSSRPINPREILVL